MQFTTPSVDKSRWAGALIPAHSLQIMLILAIGVFAAPALAENFDDLPWTEGVGRVTFETISPKQAREKALDLARRDAVAEITGYQISSTADRVRIQSGNELMDRFRQVTSSEVHGHIVEEEILRYRTEAIDELLQMVCTIRARVVVENRKPDSSFKLRSELLGPDSRVFRGGEELVLELESTKDCFVTVFNVAPDGTYSVIVPTDRLLSDRLVAGEPRTIPDESERTHSPIRVYPEPDRETTEEFLLIVATLESHPFLTDEVTDLGHGLVSTPKANPSDFSRWLLRIPPDQRTTSEVFYSIVP